MEIKPIRDDEDYEAAIAEVDRLMDLDLDEAGEDRLEVLATLVESYEQEHFPITPVSAVDAIRFRMDQAGKTQADLATLFGSRSRASEVLAGSRGLSLELIRRLHEQWGIPLESLVQEADRVAEKPARYGTKRRRPKVAAKKSGARPPKRAKRSSTSSR